MSVTKFAAFAGAAVVVTLAVTFAITQIMMPAQRFEACIEGSVAGGSIGGPFELMDHRGQMVTDAQVLINRLWFTLVTPFVRMSALWMWRAMWWRLRYWPMRVSR